jgi:4'-phosphopantetheinyl transferase
MIHLGSSGIVTVYHATLNLLRPSHVDLLSSQERRRLDRYHNADDRDRFALGAALLRAAAGEHLDVSPDKLQISRHCPDCDVPHGPPIVGGTDLACSVAHSGRHVLVALTESGDVGVDVEAVSSRLLSNGFESLLGQVLAPDETVPADLSQFLVTWTRKEALVKLSREGLRRPFASIRLAAPVAEPKILTSPPTLYGATVVDLDIADDAAAAIATNIATPTVEVRSAKAVIHPSR